MKKRRMWQHCWNKNEQKEERKKTSHVIQYMPAALTRDSVASSPRMMIPAGLAWLRLEAAGLRQKYDSCLAASHLKSIDALHAGHPWCCANFMPSVLESFKPVASSCQWPQLQGKHWFLLLSKENARLQTALLLGTKQPTLLASNAWRSSSEQSPTTFKLNSPKSKTRFIPPIQI